MRRQLAGAVVTLLFAAGASAADDAKDKTPTAQSCVAKRSGTECEVVIDRTNPASPDKIVAKPGTKVTIRIVKARVNEDVAFTPKTAQTPPPNLAEAFLKGAIDVLKNPVFAVKTSGAPPPPPPDQHETHAEKGKDPIAFALEAGEDQLAATLSLVNDAAVYLSCLNAYKGVDGTAGARFCATGSLDDDSFGDAKMLTVAAMLAAANAPLPFATVQYVDAEVKADIAKSVKIENPEDRAKALARDDAFLARQNRLSAALEDAKKAQAALLTTMAKLKALVSLPQNPTFTIAEANNYTSTIEVSAQEVMSGTKTPLGTVTIEWRSTPWAVSTGIMFSTLEDHTYSNVAVFENGQVQLDAQGKTLTMVQDTVKRPTVLFPLVMVHYKMPFWEPLMATGGVGLNLGTTTAEFVAGPSVKVLGIVFTVAAHFGRETSLSEGVKPGDKLGVAPPPPPTETHWAKEFRWGIGASYALPLGK